MSRTTKKTVAFSGRDTFIVGERTPSPLTSGSTLSSPSLSSPVTLGNPYSSSSPTFVYGEGMPLPTEPGQLNPALAVPSGNRLPKFNYDLTRNPDGIPSPFTPQGALSDNDLNGPAVSPASDRMGIIVKAGVKPIMFAVAPFPGSNFITVKDVIWTCYRALKQPADVTGLSPVAMQSVSAALSNRALKLKQKEGIAVQSFAQVDLLGTSHLFAGLVFDAKRSMWELVVQD